MYNQQCRYCGKDTRDVDIEYLVGVDHLSCALEAEQERREKANPIEKCVLCGEDTQYRFNDHVDMRNGYVEGAGQLCSKCYNKNNNAESDFISQTMKNRTTLVTISAEDILNTPNDMELGAKVRNLYYETKNNA